MDMMDSQPHAGIRCEKLRGRKREGLPRALRSSSKFSLLFIFQVPAKLGMSAEAERRELLKEPVCDAFLCPVWLFLTLLLFPCVPPLLTLTLKMQVCFWASFKCIFLLTRFHLHSVSLCTGSRLVFIAPVLNGRGRAPEGPHPSQKCCLITLGARWSVLLWLLSYLFNFSWKIL